MATGLVVLLCAVVFLANAGVTPPDIMEERNIVTAREMVYDGHWLVPTMNGELRLEKPPLPTWAAAVVEAMAPDSLGTQRLVSGLMAGLWVWVFWLTTTFVSRRRDVALVATVVLVTSFNFVMMARTASWDVWCHALMAAAAYCLMRGLCDASARPWRWLPLAGVLMGLSLMSKGPVALYATLLPFLVAMVCWQKPRLKGRWRPLLVALVLCLVVGLWWYACIYVFHADALEAVAQKESGAWGGRHVKPWYFYWQYITEMGLWAVMAVGILAFPHWRRQMDGGVRRGYDFGLVWMAAALVLLSVLPEKKTRYLLPLIPACAMAVGALLVHVCQSAQDLWGRRLFRANGYLTVLVALAVGGAAVWTVVQGWLSAWQGIVAAALVVLVAMLLALSVHRRRLGRYLTGIALLFGVTAVLLLPVAPHVFTAARAASLATLKGDGRTEGISYRHPDDAQIGIHLVYAVGQTIRPIDLNDSAAVRQALPFALVVPRSWEGTLPVALLQWADTIGLGSYDDNFSKRKYKDDLVTTVTLLTPKTNSNDEQQQEPNE